MTPRYHIKYKQIIAGYGYWVIDDGDRCMSTVHKSRGRVSESAGYHPVVSPILELSALNTEPGRGDGHLVSHTRR